MDIGSDVGDAVARSDAEFLEGRRPVVAAIKELGVGQAQIAVHHGFAVRIKAAGTAGKLKRSQGGFQGNLADD
jgi:predicted lysophospholipase L1 biosynthesis ABC-type transport system permease subunit